MRLTQLFLLVLLISMVEHFIRLQQGLHALIMTSQLIEDGQVVLWFLRKAVGDFTPLELSLQVLIRWLALATVFPIVKAFTFIHYVVYA